MGNSFGIYFQAGPGVHHLMQEVKELLAEYSFRVTRAGTLDETPMAQPLVM